MALWTPILIIVLIILGVAYYLDPKRRGNGVGRLPPIVGKIPIIGVSKRFGEDPIGLLREAHAKYKDCFTLHIAGFNMTFLVGTEGHTVFFKANDEELSQREAYKFVTPVFGKGVVFDSPTAVMYEQVKFIKSGLAVPNLRKYVPIIENEANNFFGKWGNSGKVDMLKQMNRLIILTASKCLLGDEIRSDPKVAEEFADLYHDLEGGLNPVAFFFPNAPIPAHFVRDRARKQVAEKFLKLIKQRRQSMDKEVKDDMMQTLIDSSYKESDGKTLDDNTVACLLIALLFAGQHTSGITTSWTGFYLMANPKWMNEVVEEQKRIIAKDGHEITFDTLKQSVILENCIREALRLFPPIITLMRKVKKPIQFKDYTIPVGDFCCVSPGYGMRIPDMYSNPDQYDPSRFDRGEDRNLPYNYMSFGGGRHGCPGEPFAMIQIKTVWIKLLRTFEFEKRDVPPPDYTTMIVGPTMPCYVNYKKRDVPL